jgi:hypothetical protein
VALIVCSVEDKVILLICGGGDDRLLIQLRPSLKISIGSIPRTDVSSDISPQFPPIHRACLIVLSIYSLLKARCKARLKYS